MDCSWLVEEDGDEDPGSESDPEETRAELEARLYSIVHHSDLSQPLPPDLAKHYSVQCGDDGKLTVALNESLENIKYEEGKKADDILKDSELANEVNDEAGFETSPEEIVISDNQSEIRQNAHKRFRYSDINLDLTNESLGPRLNDAIKAASSNVDYSAVNYFKISQSFLNRKKIRKLKDVVVPASFQTGQISNNWKDAANESFISVGFNNCGSEDEIINEMISALRKVNPKVTFGKLHVFAKLLFLHNRRKHRQLLKRKNKSKVNESLDASLQVERESLSTKSQGSVFDSFEQLKSNTHGDMFNGSVSLNISPFKPLQLTQSSPIVNLVSEDEVDHSNETTSINNINRKSMSKCEVPSKWTKKMIKFYTKPSGKKLKNDMNVIFEDLKRNSTKDDWRLDPRDEIGKYQRTPMKGKHKNRRCPNCHQAGHLLHECPSPRKIPSCYLCGLNYHTAYTCPNKICLKCGVYLTNEASECLSCYYSTFNYDTRCEVCGQVTHRSEVCPDLWRSFHATVEGDKKIPELVAENKRKYCCNCATRGHFSHQCPFPSCDGENLSSFVTNYSASPSDGGTTEIVIPNHASHIMNSEQADFFLQNLSNSTKALIDVEDGNAQMVVRVRGTFEQCRNVRYQIEEFVNTRKRKRHEPYFKKKRQKLM